MGVRISRSGEIKKKPVRSVKAKNKVKKVMSEFKAGTLKSSSGPKVTKKKQAIAIALSEARRERRPRRAKRSFK
jgi:glucose dehydrogenase